MAPRGASPPARSPLGPRSPRLDVALASPSSETVQRPMGSVDVESVWLSQHLACSDMASAATNGRSYDSFADLCGLVPATPPGQAGGTPPSEVQGVAPEGASTPPGDDSSATRPTAGAAAAGGAAAGAVAAERWRRRMTMARSASSDALDAWSATLGEAVSGVAVSNEDDDAHTLIRVTCGVRPGLLLQLTEHLQRQGLSVASAIVHTQGCLASDVFCVTDRATGGQVPEARHPALIAALRAMLAAGAGDMDLEGDDQEPCLRAAGAGSRALSALSAAEWEIAPEALEDVAAPPLGKGAFGEVRRARWRGTDVAVKRVSLPAAAAAQAAALELFRRELATYHLLAHPNVVQFLGAVTRSEPLCLVTELMRAGSLADALDARGRGNPPPLGRALAWALDCCRGMRYLHERRPTAVIHRDLKPANLLLSADGRLKIGDFGLSKPVQAQVARAAGQDGAVISRQTCGSWLYAAPEVLRGESYTAAVDVFAFAVVLYELLTGTLPYEGLPAERATSLLSAGRRPALAPPVYPAAAPVPPAIDALVQHAWTHFAAHRPSFAELAEALDAELVRLPPTAFREPGSGPGLGIGITLPSSDAPAAAWHAVRRGASSIAGAAWHKLQQAAIAAAGRTPAWPPRKSDVKRTATVAQQLAVAVPQTASLQGRRPPRSPTPLPRALMQPQPPPLPLPPRAGAAVLRPPGVRGNAAREAEALPSPTALVTPRRWLPPPRAPPPPLLDAFNLAAAVPRPDYSQL